jgi:hypothetical protein
MTGQLLYHFLPNQVEVSLYCDAVDYCFVDLVRREYVFSVALKVEGLPRRKVLSGKTNSEHPRFVSAGYVERLAVNDVVPLRGEFPQHRNDMIETGSMLVERAKIVPKPRSFRQTQRPSCLFLRGKSRRHSASPAKRSAEVSARADACRGGPAAATFRQVSALGIERSAAMKFLGLHHCLELGFRHLAVHD